MLRPMAELPIYQTPIGPADLPPLLYRAPTPKLNGSRKFPFCKNGLAWHLFPPRCRSPPRLLQHRKYQGVSRFRGP